MEELTQRLIKEWEETKKYVNNLGYELGGYNFDKKMNVIYKSMETHPYLRFVGYIKVGDFNSLKIVNKEV